METKKLRYILYLRKSTDAEDRQVQSIEDQRKEAGHIITRDGLNVVKEFSESRSAKKPGRVEFNKMIEMIERGEADAIICWKPNRLARNPVDGGTLLWLLQEEKLKAINTPHRVYLPTDNVIPLSVEFAMANQSSLDLAKDVKRGMLSKAEKGWRPGQAPLGYLNDKLAEKGEKIIHTDNAKFPIVRKLWDLLLTGNYTVPALVIIADKQLGLRTKRGKKISLGSLYHLFNDKFYIGEYEFDGVVYQGKHKPMISAEEFDRAQKILGRAGRPRPKYKRLPFNGLIQCASCGRTITCDERVKVIKRTGETKSFMYHRCTHKTKNHYCPQPPVTFGNLVEQVQQYLGSITIPPEFLEWAVQSLREQQKLEETNRNQILTNLRNNHQNVIDRIDALVNLYISPENKDRSILTEEDLKRQKNTLLQEKSAIERELSNTSLRVNEWVDLTIKTFHFATYAKAWFDKGDYETKTAILRALGVTFTLKDRSLLLELKGPYVVIKKGVAAGLFENPVLGLVRKALQEPALAKQPEIASVLSSWSG